MQGQDDVAPERHLGEFAAALAELTKSSDSIRHAATLGMQAAGALQSAAHVVLALVESCAAAEGASARLLRLYVLDCWLKAQSKAVAKASGARAAEEAQGAAELGAIAGAALKRLALLLVDEPASCAGLERTLGVWQQHRLVPTALLAPALTTARVARLRREALASLAAGLALQTADGVQGTLQRALQSKPVLKYVRRVDVERWQRQQQGDGHGGEDVQVEALVYPLPVDERAAWEAYDWLQEQMMPLYWAEQDELARREAARAAAGQAPWQQQQQQQQQQAGLQAGGPGGAPAPLWPQGLPPAPAAPAGEAVDDFDLALFEDAAGVGLQPSSQQLPAVGGPAGAAAGAAMAPIAMLDEAPLEAGMQPALTAAGALPPLPEGTPPPLPEESPQPPLPPDGGAPGHSSVHPALLNGLPVPPQLPQPQPQQPQQQQTALGRPPERALPMPDTQRREAPWHAPQPAANMAPQAQGLLPYGLLPQVQVSAQQPGMQPPRALQLPAAMQLPGAPPSFIPLQQCVPRPGTQLHPGAAFMPAAGAVLHARPAGVPQLGFGMPSQQPGAMMQLPGQPTQQQPLMVLPPGMPMQQPIVMMVTSPPPGMMPPQHQPLRPPPSLPPNR